jgi:hypothetical protein
MVSKEDATKKYLEVEVQNMLDQPKRLYRHLCKVPSPKSLLVLLQNNCQSDYLKALFSSVMGEPNEQINNLVPLSPPHGGRGNLNSAAAALLPTSLSFSHCRSRAWPVKAWPLPAAAGTAGPLVCQGRRGLSPSWRGHGAAAGYHGAAALRRSAARAASIWSGGCVVDGVAVGRRRGGREGRGEGRRRQRGLPFVAASLHLLGSIHGPDLGLPLAHLSRRSLHSIRSPGAG